MSSLNSSGNTGVSGFLLGSGIPSQILFTLVAGIVLFVVLFSIESLIKTFNAYRFAKTFLVPNTVISSKSIVISQDPSNPSAKMILPSDNERTGVEFTYSFFLYVDPSTFDTSGQLKQVFYKGYQKPFPLLGPGVFVRSDENTMRVFMNSYKNWYSYVDVKNIPVQKWFHCAVIYRKNNLEVYINGNMKGRVSMEDTYPYQNYQNLIIFGKTPAGTNSKKYTNLEGVEEAFLVGGSMSGQISRLAHYRYALTFSELQSDVNAGPSSQVDMPADQGAGSFIQNSLTDSWYTAGQ